jgi:hypothetical protein
MLICLPDDEEEEGDGHEDPLVEEVLPGGAVAAGGHAVALHPAEVRAHEHHEPQQEPREEAADVGQVVHVREDAQHHVHRHHEQERQHGGHLVGVDGPVGQELREHGAQEAEQGARGAHGDVVADEQGRQDAAAEAGEEVDHTNPHCKCKLGSPVVNMHYSTGCT